MARILPRNDPLRSAIAVAKPSSPTIDPTTRPVRRRIVRWQGFSAGGAPRAEAARDEQRMADANGFDLLNCQRTIAAVWRDHFPRAIMNYEF
jgi:hypothetical protein